MVSGRSLAGTGEGCVAVDEWYEAAIEDNVLAHQVTVLKPEEMRRMVLRSLAPLLSGYETSRHLAASTKHLTPAAPLFW